MNAPAKRPARKQPADRKAPAAKASAQPEPVPVAPEQYGIDTAVVMTQLGVDPRMVVDNSVRLALMDGAIVCEYTVRRAIPPRIMGLALLAGAAHSEMKEDDDEPDG